MRSHPRSGGGGRQPRPRSRAVVGGSVFCHPPRWRPEGVDQDEASRQASSSPHRQISTRTLAAPARVPLSTSLLCAILRALFYACSYGWTAGRSVSAWISKARVDRRRPCRMCVLSIVCGTVLVVERFIPGRSSTARLKSDGLHRQQCDGVMDGVTGAGCYLGACLLAESCLVPC